jgi:hypothetical protein
VGVASKESAPIHDEIWIPFVANNIAGPRYAPEKSFRNSMFLLLSGGTGETIRAPTITHLILLPHRQANQNRIVAPGCFSRRSMVEI